jgi:hypothetical protein
MKGLKTLTAVLLGVALLVVVAGPASAKKSVGYRHYVACGISEKAKPSHSCLAGSEKGAFFKSPTKTIFYSVCVKFPSGKSACKSHQKALAGKLYVNPITTTIPGKHEASWFVGNKRVGLFVFNVVANH